MRGGEVVARKGMTDVMRRGSQDDMESQALLAPDHQAGPSAPAGPATPAPASERSTNVLDVALPAMFYVGTSASLILLNKYALASFGFTCPNALVLFHCILAVVLVKGAELLGYIQLEPLTWPIIKLWFPVNLIFVGMVSWYAPESCSCSSFQSDRPPHAASWRLALCPA